VELLGRSTCNFGYHYKLKSEEGMNMEEKNELNDIILNKNRSTGGNKKIILAIATLGVILIIVVMLMNSLTSSGTDNLPQAVLPPEPKAKEYTQPADEPLFEEVEVVEDKNQSGNNLDKIAQKLKQESKEDFIEVDENQAKASEEAVQEETPEKVYPPKKAETTKKVETPKKIESPRKEEAPRKVETPKYTSSSSQGIYIQVGSLSKSQPNKGFLKSITDKGYSYEFKETTVKSNTITKILVGPFSNDREAKDALKNIRKTIEPGAFLTKI
jgi:DedD protein